jgi:hypothetical protein
MNDHRYEAKTRFLLPNASHIPLKYGYYSPMHSARYAIKVGVEAKFDNFREKGVKQAMVIIVYSDV